MRYTDTRRKFNGCLYDSGAGDLAATRSAAASRLSGRPVIFAAGSCVTLGPDFLPILDREKLNENNVSWRAAVNWQVTPRALVYANVSHGYKSGAFPVANATNYLQFAPAVQEDVVAYEAGFKVTALDRTLQLNGAAFYYDYSNKQLRGRRIDPTFGSKPCWREPSPEYNPRHQIVLGVRALAIVRPGRQNDRMHNRPSSPTQRPSASVQTSSGYRW